MKNYLGIIGIAVFSSIFLASNTNTNANTNANAIKCKRPGWKIVYNKTLKCKMRYNHYILWETNTAPEKDTVIERKNGFCRMIKGRWLASYYSGNVLLYESKDINIDHIYPVRAIRDKVGCQGMYKYYNYRKNLVPSEASYNQYKSDSVCSTKDECLAQLDSCLSMQKDIADKYKENLHCEELKDLAESYAKE